MKQRAVRTVLLALATTTAVGAATLAPAYAAVPERTAGRGHEATMAALRQMVEKRGLPGVAAEVLDGRKRWFGSAGVADTATGRKRSADDHFRAASITKPFIATVVLQLAAERRLSLDDTVEKWLPGLVRGNGNDGRTITLRQLLNHTSGLPNYTLDPDFEAESTGSRFPEHRYDNHTPQELLAVALKYPRTSVPGAKAVYSNTGYVLAGLVIEKVTGRSYAEEVTRRLIEPLELGETSFPGSGVTMPDPHPVAYSRLLDPAPDAPVVDATEQNMTYLGAAGDMISTTGDLLRFQQALMRGELLPGAQMKELLTVVPAAGGFSFGLGIGTTTLSCGVEVVGKTGRANGSMSVLIGTRDGSHQLAFNTNSDWADPSHTNVMEAEFCGKAPAPTG
ncbi:serine hydrolase domain-containing protein [Streptomyces sp. NPDC007100]|uniref:serine hydrolase domain-containing protein n=1 Tax=unclassified Streptomyces TaxID=2593676 RepID=UPI003410D529